MAIGSAGPLAVGKQRKLLEETTLGAGISVYDLTIDSDAILVSVYVRSVTSGDLSVSVNTVGDRPTENVPVITFPTISAPTSNLLLRKSTLTLQRVEIIATYTGIVDYYIIARAIQSADLTVSVSPPTTATAYSSTVTTSSTIIVPSSPNDRAGLVLRNWSNSGIIYIGFSAGEATLADGYPIGPTEQMGIDLNAGQDIWAIGTDTIDLRIMSAGS